MNLILRLAGLLFIACFLAACASRETPAQRESKARQLFNETAQTFHLPSAKASGATRRQLLDQAAQGYARVVADYADVRPWAAQAMRSLGSVRAEQERLEESVRLYEKVARLFPEEGWEVLQSLKSAADLLWDAGQKPRAQRIYSEIIAKFDPSAQSAVVKIIVRQARRRIDAETR